MACLASVDRVFDDKLLIEREPEDRVSGSSVLRWRLEGSRRSKKLREKKDRRGDYRREATPNCEPKLIRTIHAGGYVPTIALSSFCTIERYSLSKDRSIFHMWRGRFYLRETGAFPLIPVPEFQRRCDRDGRIR